MSDKQRLFVDVWKAHNFLYNGLTVYAVVQGLPFAGKVKDIRLIDSGNSIMVDICNGGRAKASDCVFFIFKREEAYLSFRG